MRPGKLLFCLTGIYCTAMCMGIAQSTLPDSILQRLSMFPDDSTRLATCIANARHADPGIATIYLLYGKQLAVGTGDRQALAKLITEEAIGANISGDHLAGAQLFLTVDSVYRVMDDSLLIAGAQTNAGLSYYYAGQYDKALTHYFEAYQIYESRQPSTAFSRLLNNLAICYKHTDNAEQAKPYYLESIAIKKHLGDSLGLANTQHNLALLLSAVGELNAAIESFDTAIAIYHALDMPGDEASSRVALGKAMLDVEQHERAADFLQSGYQYFKEEAPESLEFIRAAGEMARLAMAQKQWNRADLYVDEALILTEDADRVEERIMLLKLKAGIRNTLGDGGGAYENLRAVMTLNDSLYTKERRSLIEEMQTRFSVREKEKDLRITQLELESQTKLSQIYKTGLIAAIAVALLIAALGVFLFRSRRQIRKSNEIIAKALKEKELLLKEIHHRVKNNLQIISSLLSMQSYQSADPNVSHAVREGQSRVHAMALIHQTLYQNENIIEVDTAEYVNKLVGSLKTAYRLNAGHIRIETDVDPMKLDVDVMIPLGLILNELITNALKYAFPAGRPGEISIDMKNLTGEIMLRVKDDGIGIPDPGRLEHTTSMGFTLVQDFCAKLKGTFHVRSEQGVEIVIRFPHLAISK